MQVDQILTNVPPRPFDDLVTSGLLWLINASVFHPRGLALGVTRDPEGHVIGWLLLGNGTEPWSFPDDRGTLAKFQAAQTTLVEAVIASQGTAPGVRAMLVELRNDYSPVEHEDNDAP